MAGAVVQRESWQGSPARTAPSPLRQRENRPGRDDYTQTLLGDAKAVSAARRLSVGAFYGAGAAETDAARRRLCPSAAELRTRTNTTSQGRSIGHQADPEREGSARGEGVCDSFLSRSTSGLSPRMVGAFLSVPRLLLV